jgi:hypothetical protein
MPQPVKARVWGMLMKSDVLFTTCVRAPYVSIRQHTSAYVRIRPHTCASTTWVRVALGSSILHMLYVRKIHLERNVCVYEAASFLLLSLLLRSLQFSSQHRGLASYAAYLPCFFFFVASPQPAAPQLLIFVLLD